MRALLVISNLEYGGAQRQVVALANHLGATGFDTHVCTLSDYVPLATDLIGERDRLHIIPKRRKFDLSVVPRLRQLIERLEVDIVHAFLFDAEIAARMAGRRRGHVAIIGSERNTDYQRKWRHTAALRLTRRKFDAIIANSEAGRKFQIRTLDIPEDRIFVVRNGVDVDRFHPAPTAPARKKLGLDEVSPVVGMFCSFKQQKNHAMFFRMAQRLLNADARTRFLCVGAELHDGLQHSDRYRREMLVLADSLGVSNAVSYLGNRDDVADLYHACDVTVLTSKREGTPNVLLESMASGVPVVATDVADNAAIVPDGRVGYVVAYDDDASMAERVGRLLTDRSVRESFGQEARRWVEAEFTLDRLAAQTADVYHRVFARKNGFVRQ